MNYDEMSDREINVLVAEQAHPEANIHTDHDCNLIVLWAEPYKDNVLNRSFDPCNSWADAGPIIHENFILLFSPTLHEREDHDIHDWQASIELRNGKFCTQYGKNPLRAAMICFLKMKEE